MRYTVAFHYFILAHFALSLRLDFWRSLRQTVSSTETASPQQEKHTTRQATTDTDKTTRIYNDETLSSNSWQTEPTGNISQPTVRSSIFKFGATVACWPSSDTPRQFNQTAEDEFCLKLRMIEADWWRNSNAQEPTIKRQQDEKIACYIPIAQAEKMGEAGWIKYHNAMDMEERCYEIIAMGGKRCYCRSGCPDLGKNVGWGFTDPGDDGCDDPDGFHPKETAEVHKWARDYCERNGWRKRPWYC